MKKQYKIEKEKNVKQDIINEYPELYTDSVMQKIKELKLRIVKVVWFYCYEKRDSDKKYVTVWFNHTKVCVKLEKEIIIEYSNPTSQQVLLALDYALKLFKQ